MACLEEWMKENGYVYGDGKPVPKDNIIWKMRDAILKRQENKYKE